MNEVEEKLKQALLLLDQFSTLVYNIDCPMTGYGYKELIEFVDDDVYEFILENRND